MCPTFPGDINTRENIIYNTCTWFVFTAAATWRSLHTFSCVRNRTEQLWSKYVFYLLQVLLESIVTEDAINCSQQSTFINCCLSDMLLRQFRWDLRWDCYCMCRAAVVSDLVKQGTHITFVPTWTQTKVSDCFLQLSKWM